MLTIGVTGTLGAGKGAIVEYLVKYEGFRHFSVRMFVSEEIMKRGLEVNRDSMVLVANDLRKKNSPSYIIDQLYIQAETSGKDSVIESIRTPGEVMSLREKGNFYLFAVDAPAEIRYERIRKRQSETDDISFATFMRNELREMQSSNPNEQNVARCMQMADVTFINNGTIEQLNNKVNIELQRIKSTGNP